MAFISARQWQEKNWWDRQRKTINKASKVKISLDSVLRFVTLRLKLPHSISLGCFVWMGIYCVIKISDKKNIYILYIYIYRIARATICLCMCLWICLLSACIAFIWTKCTYICQYECVLWVKMHINAEHVKIYARTFLQNVMNWMEWETEMERVERENSEGCERK